MSYGLWWFFQHLVQWDAGNSECLLQLVKELLQQYHNYQCERLRESSRLLFEYDSLLEDPSYGRNMEIYAGKKNSWVSEWLWHFDSNSGDCKISGFLCITKKWSLLSCNWLACFYSYWTTVSEIYTGSQILYSSLKLMLVSETYMNFCTSQSLNLWSIVGWFREGRQSRELRSKTFKD